MESQDQESVSIGGARASVVRKTVIWYFVLTPSTLLYIGIALPFAWKNQPISRFFDMPINHAESLLLDLCFAMLPLVGLIASYVFWLYKKAKLARREFVSDFDESELVNATHNRNLVYQFLMRRTDGSIDEMRVVWTPEGRRKNGKVYSDVDENSIREFDANRFLQS